MLVISNELRIEINLILSALGQPSITQQELTQLGLFSYPNFDTYNQTCQAIICVCLLFKARGVPCIGKDLEYLQNLADNNSCGISCNNIGYTNNKIYMIGGNSGYFNRIY